MEYIAKNIPLWQVTTWDKNFNNVDRSWQPKTIKYNYLLSDELDEIRTDDGDVRILYTGKDIGYTTESLAGVNLSEGEIVSIPWGGIPTVKYYKGKFVTGDNRIATSNDVSKLSNKYLYYYMKGHIHEIASYYRGASLKHPCMKDVLKMEISYPSIEIQNRICDQFDVIEAVIEQRSKELSLFDELIKARFVELFGNPKINEKKWDTGTVSQFYEVKGGKRIPKGMGYADGITAHPYLRATDMKNETILDDDIHYIDEDVFEKIKRYTVKGGDIYLTNVGVNLGMAGVIPDKYDGANLTENAVKLVPKTNLVLDGLFLAHYINSPGIQDYINERKMSVGVPKLAIFRIETMPLILPPMNLQIEFINFCKQVDKSKVAVQKALGKTQLLFDSLMQEYFG